MKVRILKEAEGNSNLINRGQADLLYSSQGFSGRKPRFGLEVTSPSNIYNSLLYFIEQDGRSKVNRQFRVNITPCKPEDIYKNSIPVDVFMAMYEKEKLNKDESLKENAADDIKKLDVNIDTKSLYKFVVDEYKKAFANGTDRAWKSFYNKIGKKVKELNLGDVDLDTLVDAAMEFHVDESLKEGYKLRFYKTKKGIDQGNLDHEEFFDTKEEAVSRYKQVFDRKNYALNPTVWVGNGDDWKRLSEIEINESFNKPINEFLDDSEETMRHIDKKFGKGASKYIDDFCNYVVNNYSKEEFTAITDEGYNRDYDIGSVYTSLMNNNEHVYKMFGDWYKQNRLGESLNRKKRGLTEAMEKPYFRAFITNLGKYNEGELVGDWVDFPIDEDEFEEKLAEIGIGSEDEFGQPYEEWFVTDYECNLDAFEWEELGEYPSYETLQEFGELVDSVDDVVAVNNAYEVTGDLREAIEGLDNGDIYFYPGVNSWGDLAYYFMENIYGSEEEFFRNMDPLTFERHFDFRSLGRDLGFDTYESEDEDGNEVQLNAGEYWCGDENASDYEIGEAFVDQVGFDGVDNPEYYFDYESYGRDFQYDNFTITSDGIIEYR